MFAKNRRSSAEHLLGQKIISTLITKDTPVSREAPCFIKMVSSYGAPDTSVSCKHQMPIPLSSTVLGPRLPETDSEIELKVQGVD